MPEKPPAKLRPHPFRAAPSAHADPRAAATLADHRDREPAYAELEVTSNFTFLAGASHPDELVTRAAELATAAIALTDTNSVAGIVRAHEAARSASIPFIVGCRLLFSDPANLTVLVYPTDLDAYGRLCTLLTLGKRRAAKGQCDLRLDDLADHHAGLLAVAVPPDDPDRLDADFAPTLARLRDLFDDDRLSLAATFRYDGRDRCRLTALAALSRRLLVPLVATNDVRYHSPERRPLHDVLTCVRHGCTIEQAGLRLLANAERRLKPPAEMRRLFADHPHALARTLAVARRARAFSLDSLRYEYPDEVCPPDTTPARHLADLVARGAADRYPAGVPDKVRRQLDHELALITELRYEPYFLTCHDLVAFARSRGILCQGRGAAANSAVCFCLAITSVDPDRIDVLFERFVSRERDEPPDIDIDFEHERREEVIQYIYRKYGRHRAALTAEIITYRGRSAVRDVGKALGLSLDSVDRLARSVDRWGGSVGDQELRQLGFNPDDPTIRRLVDLVGQVVGFPRHLSQHVGGFVITRRPLSQLVPIENAAMPDRTVIEWDKDDIDAMGMLKIDVLGLGMLTCLRKTFDLIDRHAGRRLTLATIPPEDPATYDMICRADTLGVFQIESRAQMNMLPRLRPRCFYDLVIEVAIVRPGPIIGDMVHPYLRRRSGAEPIVYPDDAVRRVLAKTLGIPLFQEQAMTLSMVAAGFTADESDRLRRAIASKTRRHQLDDLGRRLVEGMVRRGYTLDFAESVFRQIQGFSHYGFPESHAASFALLVYASAWLKRHQPAAFTAALLNSQPMGFYAPAQIVRDARRHAIDVRPIDVAASLWDCTLEDGGSAVRLGMRLVRGLPQRHGLAIADAVARHGPFPDIESLWKASGVPAAALARLAEADAMRSFGLDRQHALWEIGALRNDPLPLFDTAEAAPSTQPAEPAKENAPMPARSALPPVPELRKVFQDYAAAGLTLRDHPMRFLRSRLKSRGVVPIAQLENQNLRPHRSRVSVAGVVTVRQRPSTANGILFITIEDETGMANLIVRSDVYERCRKAARDATVIVVRGRIERAGQVVHVLAHHVADISHELKGLLAASRDFH